MPVIQKTISIAAGATNENILAGSAFEFARGNQLVSIAIVATLVSGFVTIQAGADIVLEESELAIKATFPVIPDEFYYNDVATAGDRLVLRVRNANAAANVVRAIVQVTPL